MYARSLPGAVSPAYDALLRRYARLAREAGVVDYTVYGESRSSPQDFYLHHLSAHSAAVVYADVDTLLDAASCRSFWLARG